MSYETSQMFVVILAALIIIGFTVWLFAQQWVNSTKSLLKKFGFKKEDYEDKE
jgi:hypothetical protein